MFLTVDQALKMIHQEYEGDVDYPEFEDDETQLRVGHLKSSLREWGNRFHQYRELFAFLSDADDGDKVTTAGSSKYSCPIDFVRPSSFITVGGQRLDYIPPQKMEQKLIENSSDPWFSITGSPSKYKLIINPAPSDSGLVIEYPYWRTVTQPSLTTDVLEISRPLFCFHYVLWKLFLDDDPVRAKEHKDLMNEQERLERIELAKTSGTPNRMQMPGFGFGVRNR